LVDLSRVVAAATYAEARRLVEQLNVEWRYLWETRIDDEVRAEGIARGEFPDLFVESGTVIIATRDYRPLSFEGIVERHLSREVVARVRPRASVGGMGKFIKEMKRQGPIKRASPLEAERKGRKLQKGRQLKKGGRGWLHCM
jgi:hypothetical protein